ncbi:MAG TPA: DUF885 domain-containing protein [Candidatus Limnocylindrales bacterium]|nr:DUF885 domain-containing protein [Candidatus Limnocylindrales bacterium]
MPGPSGPSGLSRAVATFLDEWFALEPVHATSVGRHERDDRWPDRAPAARPLRLAFIERWLAAFVGFADADLDRDERVDRDVLIGLLEDARFEETQLRTDAWSPMFWVYLIGDGLFSLIVREFAPLAIRLDALAGRAEGLPDVLEAARATLVGHAGRPVDRFHTSVALDQWPGLIGILDEALAGGEAAAAADPEVVAVLPRLRAARERAAAALDAMAAWLRDEVLPSAAGEGRLGADWFAAKMAHTLRDPEMTPERIRTVAEREFDAIRAEMIRIAREIAPHWLGSTPIPEDDADVVRAVLAAVSREHPAAGDLLAFCRTELGRIEAFCREADLVGLADEPLEIAWTPVFLRAFGNAMLSSPGPLEPGQKAMFFITPSRDDATPEQVESRLREDNDRMLRILTIHEAVPGHYLQGVYANRVPSLVRSIFYSGVYAEGWAVYVTQVMMDTGFAAADPALMLCHWKYYLRCVINARIDVGIHTAAMTEDEAVGLMIDGGFQEEAEARAKWNRARLSSTQLSTYFVGSLAFWDLEREVRRRAAVASGDPRGSAAVPEPPLVGGFGETPGFRYRDHLEACMNHGGVPMPLLRRLLLGPASD